jgi:hypothetical protein
MAGGTAVVPMDVMTAVFARPPAPSSRAGRQGQHLGARLAAEPRLPLAVRRRSFPLILKR